MTTQVKPIRGRIAQILNSREVALNVGSNKGVEIGMLFDIVTLGGYEITDPDTDEILGSLDKPKVRVRVVSVQDRLSVATTYRKMRENIGGAGSFIEAYSRMLAPPKRVVEYETLKTADPAWQGLLDEDSYISRGDPVVQVFGDDENSA